MKKLFLALILLAAVTSGYAQASTTKPAAETLLMTIYEDWGIGSKAQIILTHQDGSQDSRTIRWPAPYNEKRLAIREDSLMIALQPFLQAGWKIVTTSTTGGGPTASTETTRIFFRKESF